MGQVQPRNLDTVAVFEGSQPDFLIPNSTVIAAVGSHLAPAVQKRMQHLTLRDLLHLQGFQGGPRAGGVSPVVKELHVEDIHLLGKIFSKHTRMLYPEMVYSCCCCT